MTHGQDIRPGKVRRVLVGVLVVFLLYVTWLAAEGRFAAGVAALWHPTGPYWVTSNIQPNCVDAKYGQKSAAVEVSRDSDAEVKVKIETFNQQELRLLVTVRENKTTPRVTNSVLGPTQFILPKPYMGQSVLVNSHSISIC